MELEEKEDNKEKHKKANEKSPKRQSSVYHKSKKPILQVMYFRI